jgi:hypothetical protein
VRRHGIQLVVSLLSLVVLAGAAQADSFVTRSGTQLQLDGDMGVNNERQTGIEG